MVQEKLPPWLTEYTNRMTALGLFSDREANHVLVNEYKAGEGIMPHEDGPLFYPVITTINLGSHTVLDFYHKLEDRSDVQEDTRPEDGELPTKNSSLKSRHFLSLLLEPRSLVVLEEDMYIKYLHGIQMQTEDVIDEKIKNLKYCRQRLEKDTILQRQTRVSLTIRHVPNVLKVKIQLGRK
jgi:alkylated DNA repair protein alkB family protein 6